MQITVGSPSCSPHCDLRKNMAMTSKTWSWMEDVLPFVVMMVVVCLNMSLLTIVKAAMNEGMESIVYIVYHNALGTLIILPFFIIHVFRNVSLPSLSFHVLLRFFVLGLLGICLFQVPLYVGIGYSSPTMASAIMNLAPAFTFLIAVILRMENVDIRSSSSRAKLIGTIIAISGAMVFTLYQGPEIFKTILSPKTPNHLLSSRPSNWVLGGLILVISGICGASWNVLQTATAREYPDELTIIFFFCLFGTIQCIALSLVLARNSSAWVLQPGIKMIAVVWGAVFGVVFHSNAVTWCLRKKGPVFVALFAPLSIVISVIMGVTFLGDSLHVGSAIGATIVAAGFYTVMWGHAKEKNKLPMETEETEEDLDVADESDLVLVLVDHAQKLILFNFLTTPQVEEWLLAEVVTFSKTWERNGYLFVFLNVLMGIEVGSPFCSPHCDPRKDMAMTSKTWSWMEDVLPFVVMMVVTCLDMSILTIVKAAMNECMDSIVYIVYHNVLGTLILLPFFILHIIRNVSLPSLGFHILSRFFILGLLGICIFQVLLYVGIGYSSPTMVSAISNLGPAFTFLIAVIFRMEKLDIRSSSSRAKLIGTIIAISGAMVFTLYQGPEIFKTILSPKTPNHLLSSRPSNWVLGGLILVITGICGALWNVLQTATAREYPDELTIIFFFCLFGTIQCTALALVLERNPSAWVLQPGLKMIAVVWGAVFGTVFRSNALTWCLRKKGPLFVAMFSPLMMVIAVIMGFTFLGDSLHLGSAIGAAIVSAGFYTVMWGHAKEKDKLPMETVEDLDGSDESGSSNQNTPLLSSRNNKVINGGDDEQGFTDRDLHLRSENDDMAMRSKTWSWMEDVMPFVVMMVMTCLDLSSLTVVKAAMNEGMESIVFTVYQYALGTLIILPFFIVHIIRNASLPSLSFHVLLRFFILGLLGISLFQVLMYVGIDYSSPTMASAISNLAPALTFLIAVIFRMEKLDIRSSSSQAKLIGTIIAISGAMVFTLYQGPEIFKTILSPNPPNHLQSSPPSNWVLGSLILVISGIFGASWCVLQTATAREYPDELTIVFFFCVFGTIQCIALSLVLERNPSSWVLGTGIRMIAVVWGRGPVFVAMFSPLSIVIAVIMGVTFLGDSLHLGSAIGAAIISAGFYTVMWGHAKEKDNLPMETEEDLDGLDESGSSNQKTPLLSSRNESKFGSPSCSPHCDPGKDMAMTSKTWSWMEDVLPFVVMMVITCLDMSILTIVKAAMNEGMDSIVYIVYHNALGTLIILPFFIVHIIRLCLFQVLLYVGIDYSSPTMASATSNLAPAFTFLIAVIFRMEKLDIRSSSSRAKLIGTIIAISGAMVFTLYQGPEIFKTILSSKTPNHLLSSRPSNWVLGGLILVITGICGALWNVLQTATAREYPDGLTIIFFFYLFGTIQCIALSPFLERNPSAWVLQPGLKIIAVVLGAVCGVFRINALTWCLRKKVIMGVTFLGDSLHLGSAIGAAIVAAGFYTVMWGHAKENDNLPMETDEDLDGLDESGSSNRNTPLLPSRSESKYMSIMTLVKAAMNEGMDSIVYIVYHNALGTLVLLPFFIVHIFRTASLPSLNIHLLLRFFVLGLLWICTCQVFLYLGINYSSPTMSSAIANLAPAITFLIAVIFRMEKVEIRSSSSLAKLFGTIIAILGATVFTLYQGPEIFKTILSPDAPNQLLSSQPSNWVLGGVLIVISVICACTWNVLQTATAREYPDQLTIVFFFTLFGTIQCIPLALVLERNPSAWVMQPGIRMIAVACGAIYSVAFRNTVATWCLRKKGPVFVVMFSPLSIVIAVIMGVSFLGDSLHLGSAIGAAIVAAGFYTVMWGHAKEKNKLPMETEEDLDGSDESGSSNQNTPLLSSRNVSKYMSMLTIVKAAMNEGMDSIVYIVYHIALGTLILLPVFIVHIFRNVSLPSLSFHLILRFFILGLLWSCFCQVLLYVGIGYSSPTMASAISNLSPASTFLIAVIFRMEKVDIRSSSSRAKLVGTVIAISGAMVFTLYQGPEIFKTILSPKTSNHLLSSQPSNWVLGGLILVISGICGALWNVLQTATAREYPDRLTIVFFFTVFATIQCIALSLVLVRNPSDWVLQPGIRMIAVVCGAVFSVVFRNNAAIWCLRKKGPVFVAMFSPLSIVIAVILGVIFLGDSLHLGSAIGAAIVSTGFYTVMWGHAKENKLPMEMEEDLDGSDESGSSNHNTPLLSSTNESKC
ncbi:hypothetical protein OSB04_000776 [Centaurea solstitialis]|uniref:EamA domain-containing protein n=1 Tax=Centaurea solstitialis TaxID=347529 RepID=A0AA38TPR3_9ASTR|nr:hypothetical protein OSB04_000776 [Centaurea solstitialis]